MIIGQKKIIKELTTALEITKAEKRTMPHILFYGGRGMGKTTLSSWVSDQIGSKFYAINGGMITKENLGDTLLQLKKGDVLFIDEVHSIRLSAVEELYTPMQDYVINYYFMGAITKVDMPEFTLVGATTEAGKLSKPLLDRFIYSFIMEPYTPDELKDILITNARRKVDEDALLQLVALSQSNPRVGINLLISCENLTRKTVTIDIVNNLMELRGIRSNGVSDIQIKYLEFLNNLNVPVGKNYLATFIGLSESMIEDHIEPLLVQKGLMVRSQKGRLITPKGKQLFI